MTQPTPRQLERDGDAPSLKDRVGARVQAARHRPLVDHLVHVVQRYGEAKGNLQAGAITYFGFLSFFPIMLLAFTVVGWVSIVYPESKGDLVRLLQSVFPNIIGGDDGDLRMADIEKAAAVTGPIAFVGILYAGLGWVSAMREALVVVFDVDRPVPNLLVAKARDLGALVTVGSVLLVSVAVSSLVSWFAAELLDLLTLGEELAPLVVALSLVLGIGASALFFFLLFRLLARPDVPARSLLTGALVGALAFEALKRLSSLLITLTEGKPSFQMFGLALILVVWINYFARVVVLAACWAWTTREARALRDQEARSQRSMEDLTRVQLVESHHVPVSRPDRSRLGGAFAAGAGAMLGVVGVVRRRGGED